MKSISLLIIFILSLYTATSQALPALTIDNKAISISGVSSGAFMAVQMGVAYSKTFTGVASIAGGIYSCSQGQALRSTEQCMKKPQGISVENFVQYTKNLDKTGFIDSVDNLKDQNIYIFSSLGDSVVNTKAGEKLKEYYLNFIPKKNILFKNTPRTAHGFPTLDQGADCLKPGIPWINNCQFDAAQDLLQHLYGPLKSKSTRALTNLKAFDQTLFGGAFSGLENKGWVYIPEQCYTKTCRLHVALHGCQMSSSYIDDLFATTAGYNPWADSNDIVILYPQALKNSFTNPNGCWDWFGYTGPYYATQYGPQMQALMKMIKALSKE